MNTTLAEPATFTRSSNDWITAVQLRALLKTNLGLNARQVSVSTDCCSGLTLTVRDATVDFRAVEAFAALFHTSKCDETDYHTGQSVRAETTKEVDAIHAAPFVEEIKLAIDRVVRLNLTITTFNNCKRLNFSNHDFYVSADSKAGSRRGCYITGYEAKAGTGWAIQALAKQAARV